jgi:hypothetical protein
VPKHDLRGSDMVQGFDYDHSIKHQLPPGFNYAMKIATSMLDPGLYSDAYCDEPYLYGPTLSGVFALHIGDLTADVSAEDQIAQFADGVVEEGGSGTGLAVRKEHQIPGKWKKRRKHFLNADALANFTFEKGRMYHADFFNPHLDFANFALRLPGFSISVAKYIDEKTHHLRYVLKNRSTGETAFVVVFRLLFGEELERVVEGEREKSEEGYERRNGEVFEIEGEKRESQKVTVQDGRPAQNRSDHEIQRTPEQNPTPPQIHTKEPPTQAAPPTSDDTSDEDRSTYSALSNNIYAALAAMGLWNDTSSSSSSATTSRDPSPPASTRSLEAAVDDMDDATVEQYLQSRQGRTG